MTTKAQIEKILHDDYGAGIGIFDPTPIGWAAEKAETTSGAEAVKAAVRKINSTRDRLALPPVAFPYGHKLF